MLVYMAETPSRTLQNISFHFSRSELSEVNLNLPQERRGLGKCIAHNDGFLNGLTLKLKLEEYNYSKIAFSYVVFRAS